MNSLARFFIILVLYLPLVCLAGIHDLQSIPSADHWVYDHVEDPMANGKNHTAMIVSNNIITPSSTYAKPIHAALMIRTHPRFGKDIMLMLDNGQFTCLLSSCSALLRFDDEDAVSVDANQSTTSQNNLLFLQGYDSILQKIKVSKRLRISTAILGEGNPVFEFNIHYFDEHSYLSEKAEITGIDTKSTDSTKIIESKDFPQPNWCKKAKTNTEVTVCQNKELSMSAIALDKAWDAYRAIHSENEIKTKRAYLKDWNKNTFQSCNNNSCIDNAYNQALKQLN